MAQARAHAATVAESARAEAALAVAEAARAVAAAADEAGGQGFVTEEALFDHDYGEVVMSDFEIARWEELSEGDWEEGIESLIIQAGQDDGR